MLQTEVWAKLATRVCGLFIAALGLWQMAGNVISTFRDIDPSYLGYYFSSQLARPLAGIIIGLLMWLLSRPIGKLLARGLDK